MNCKKGQQAQRQVSGTHLITAAKRKENGKEWRQLKELKGHIEQNNIYIKGIPQERKRYEYNETFKKLSYDDKSVKSNSICKYLYTQIGPPEYIKQNFKDLKREINSYTIILKDFDTTISSMDISLRKINKKHCP